MKLTNIILFKVSINSYTGRLIQEIIVEAEDIQKALEIANQFAESVDGEVGKINKSYFTAIKSTTKTITVEV